MPFFTNRMKPKNKIATFFDALFVNFRHFNLVLKVEKVISKMRPAEKMVFFFVAIVCIGSSLTLLARVNNSFLVEVPSFGGSFVEGVVGSPRFVNPILAISDTDKDLSSLIYSGLLKPAENGSFVADLADSYEVKENGTVYNFIIRNNAFFHDGQKVTADDVIFTVTKILDPIIKSPKKASWEGILAEKISDNEVKFTLAKPYAPFLETLTVGILPKHIWENATSEEFPFSEFNINPVGSGPYKIDKIERNSGGIPTSIALAAFKKYSLGWPKIKSIIFKFFQNESELLKAYQADGIESMANISPAAGKRFGGNANIVDNISLPRVFGVFLNQNTAPVFLNQEIREALDKTAPKKRILEEVLSGFGRKLDGPTPADVAVDAVETDLAEAKQTLLANGWKENENGILEKKSKTGTAIFKFNITTSDAPELKKTAEILKETWEKLGAQIEIKVFEAGDLSQNIIRGRKYDALLFGEVISESNDLYPFWHSSSRIDPGLNISLYANITVDKMLEDIQKGIAETDGRSNREIAVSEIKKDTPAIFLFSPNLLYVKAPQVKNISLKDVSSPSERFIHINDWFIETDKVWKIFTTNNTNRIE